MGLGPTFQNHHTRCPGTTSHHSREGFRSSCRRRCHGPLTGEEPYIPPLTRVAPVEQLEKFSAYAVKSKIKKPSVQYMRRRPPYPCRYSIALEYSLVYVNPRKVVKSSYVRINTIMGIGVFRNRVCVHSEFTEDIDVRVYQIHSSKFFYCASAMP